MNSRRRGVPASEIAVWVAIFCGLVCLVVLARTDRTAGRTVTARDRQTISLRPVPLDRAADTAPPPVVPADHDPAHKVQEAEERSQAAKEELARVRATLESTQNELRQIKEQTDANAVRTKREIEESRAELERKREELEAAVKETDAKLARAREEMAEIDGARRRRLRVVAEEGVARAAGRDERLDFQIRHDPRRLRDPALTPFAANQAAVAAAGAGGGGFGGAGMPPGSTAAGDAARGYAAMTAAQGEANLRNSQAAINAQTATAMGMENRLRWTETFFEMRRINRAARALEDGPPVTMSQAIRMAAEARPRRLTERELDPVTGDIVWPIVLTDALYRYQVGVIQDCFHKRADLGGAVTFEQSELLGSTIDDLVTQLKNNVAKYAGGKYGVARTFLDSLRLEYEMPID